jgi:hypothetical protein
MPSMSKSNQPAETQQITVASLNQLAAYVSKWMHENRPSVESTTEFVAHWTNASAALGEYERYGSITALYKTCQHLWGINPPKEVEVFGNAPFSYRLKSRSESDQNLKNRITILVRLDAQFQLEYILDNGKRTGCHLFPKDTQLIDILRYARNLISPYNVETNILYEVAR